MLRGHSWLQWWQLVQIHCQVWTVQLVNQQHHFFSTCSLSLHFHHFSSSFGFIILIKYPKICNIMVGLKLCNMYTHNYTDNSIKKITNIDFIGREVVVNYEGNLENSALALSFVFMLNAIHSPICLLHHCIEAHADSRLWISNQTSHHLTELLQFSPMWWVTSVTRFAVNSINESHDFQWPLFIHAWRQIAKVLRMTLVWYSSIKLLNYGWLLHGLNSIKLLAKVI